MAAYRDLVNTDGVYIHYELNGNFADSEGTANTSGLAFGGTTSPTNVTSFVKNQPTGNSAKDFSSPCDRGIYVGTVAQAQACFATDLDDNDAFSIEAWYKPTTLRTTGVNNIIRHDGTLWWLRVEDKKLNFLINTTTTSNTGVSGLTTLANGGIYHLVGTWDGDKLRVYVNGVLDNTSSSITGTFTAGTAANDTYLGSPGSETLDGVLDEVALYRKALSAAEVESHYASGINLKRVDVTKANINTAGTTIPSVQIIGATVGTPYKLHANGDYTPDYARIAGEGWTYTSNGGTPHYTDVDESVVDYTDYITMSGTQSNNNLWYYNLTVDPYVGHGGRNDPSTGKGHILRYAYKIVTSSVSSGQNAAIWLYSGNDYIGEFGNTQFGLSLNNQGDPIIFQKELTEAQANSINNYSDLYFVPYMYGSTTETVDIRWYWFELEVPEVQVIGGLAFKTNIGVTGFAPTISTTSNISIVQDTTDVNVVGHVNVVNIINPLIINVVTTNISVNGQDATINVTSNVQVENTFNTINILGHNVDLILGGSFTSTPETTLITLDAHDATVTIINPTIVNVTSSNISLDAKNTSSLYYDTVIEHSPIHWWRLTEETSPTLISDEGSNPISGTSNVVQADYIHGIPGAWSDGKEALTLGTSFSTFKGIKFSSNPIANNSNITLEFWIKPQQINVNASAFINYFNNASAGVSGANNVRTTIGLYDGQAAILKLYYTSNGLPVYEITTVSNNIIVNQWNHIVLTKSTSGQTANYRSYVNGVETATPLSIGTFFSFGDNNITHQSLGTAVDSNNTFILNLGLPGNAVFDEFAVYDTALSLGQIQEHYTSGLLGPLNTTVSVDHTDIFVSGIFSGSSPSITAPISNIGITGRNPTLNITGAPTIITNAPNIGIDAQDITFTTGGFKTISVQKSNIDISINLPKVRTRTAEFIFIDKNDVSLSAINATETNGIDFGGLLYNQIKKDLFKIGNTSDFICSFNISVFSKETQVISAVELSIDNINYSDTIYIENIGPNKISDNIYVKFDVNALDVLGPGTFLINVEQIYVF